MNYLTDNCSDADKKSSNKVLTITVAHGNNCDKWLLIVLYLLCTQHEKPCDTKQEKIAVHIGFWKLCTAAVHVDTALYLLARTLKYVSLQKLSNWKDQEKIKSLTVSI